MSEQERGRSKDHSRTRNERERDRSDIRGQDRSRGRKEEEDDKSINKFLNYNCHSKLCVYCCLLKNFCIQNLFGVICFHFAGLKSKGSRTPDNSYQNQERKEELQFEAERGPANLDRHRSEENEEPNSPKPEVHSEDEDGNKSGEQEDSSDSSDEDSSSGM